MQDYEIQAAREVCAKLIGDKCNLILEMIAGIRQNAEALKPTSSESLRALSGEFGGLLFNLGAMEILYDSREGSK